jgi:(S)-ureidoglycine aminohydrolase
LQHLGQTRSARIATHLLQAPDTFVRAPLPGMLGATAIVHMSPSAGARFTEYTVEFDAGGTLPPAVDQRFIYVLDGTVTVDGRTLEADGFAYVPAAGLGTGAAHAGRDREASHVGGDREASHVGRDREATPAGAATAAGTVTASTRARIEVIEKPYEPLDDVAPPAAFGGREVDVTPTFLGDDTWLEVRALIPDHPAFDFRVNTMTYRPGAALSMVEVHVMEHGLLMLEGGGIYRLGDSWYSVEKGDFIWMAPFCPQWFGALGKTPAKYLIYKDWARHPR